MARQSLCVRERARASEREREREKSVGVHVCVSVKVSFFFGRNKVRIMSVALESLCVLERVGRYP